MFSGIVSGIGTVRDIRPIAALKDMRITIAAPWTDTRDIALGASICCSGCCLTVVAKGADWFAADVSSETLAHSTLGRWRIGRRLNLERSLRAGDDLGGHFVFGHVDAVGEALESIAEHGSVRWHFRAPSELMRSIAIKGSIAVDGVSLTVNAIGEDTFAVNIIAHTAGATSFGWLAARDLVNLEIDVLARYVARLAELR
ncbi:MAG: riboflavin synthase [Acetobacteraceae bacterium]